MNERVMQFRIGMFVIVAGLVLTMMVVWFGESPSLFRDHVYVTVQYREAPGVSEGIPVRKSGIRVGEVASISFDERPGQPDGVLVTLSIDRKFKIKAGSVPRLSKTLMGDVSIDFLPGEGPGLLPMSPSPNGAPVIAGDVAPDPSRALAAATAAFEKAGNTLLTIDKAAAGLAKISESADDLELFLTTWRESGKKVSLAADSIDRFIKANEGDFQPTVTNLRRVSEKLNATLDPRTQAAFKAGIDRFATASARLDTGLANVTPLLKDLGAPVNSNPSTDFGQTVRRLNLISSDLSLLTRQLSDGKGNLNPNGSLQKLIMKSELHDNLNHAVTTASETFGGLKAVVALLRVFAEKIARDPAAIGRGALSR
jgi:phospholipid/cholesterol/gamma-HCH transport system substrate-binding protein